AVADVVHGAVARAARLYPDAATRLHVYVQRGLPPVYVDGLKLTRALTQIIDNGLKFGAPGPVEVSATAVGDRGDIAISVRDYGLGMSPEQLRWVTVVLEQGEENPPTRHYGGFGIGLAMAKMIL